MKYLDIEEARLQTLGARHTAVEIAGQPTLWEETYRLFTRHREELHSFVHKSVSAVPARILLCGAGTSAFIGEALAGLFQKISGIDTRAVATTDIVTHPGFYFSGKNILMISFARSGNSPESVKAVELADALCDTVSHLIISCNPQGQLALRGRQGDSYVFLLPPEADDKSLAMTGSFSAMMLSGLLLANLWAGRECAGQVLRLAGAARAIMDRYREDLKNIAAMDFDRAVFLGSGPAAGIARESHLKLQELTDGAVICKFDSFLGFRHGPKAVVTPRTLLVFFLSSHEYVRPYESDLIDAVNHSEKGIFRIAVTEEERPDIDVDLQIVCGDGSARLEEGFLAIAQVVVAQLLGFFKSLHLGLNPDTPSKSGTITRVVEGVRLYPYQQEATNRSAGYGG